MHKRFFKVPKVTLFLQLLDKFGKQFRLLNRHFREDFAVEFDFFVDEDSDKLAILQPQLPHSGVEAYDPNSAVGAFLGAPVAKSVGTGLDYGLFGRAIVRLSFPAIAFGVFEEVFSSPSPPSPCMIINRTRQAAHPLV